MTTFDQTTSTTPDRAFDPPTSAAVLATCLAAAAAAGVLAGAATSYLQGRLPADWSQLANSGAVWTVVAFAVAALCTDRRWIAVAAGGLSLVGEVGGYYWVAAHLREIPTTGGQQALWMVAALWIGPAAGFAGWCVRRGGGTRRLVATLTVAGMVAGEGMYEVSRLGYRQFGQTEIVIAAVVATLALVGSRAGWGARLLAVAAAGMVAVSTFAVYAQTILM